MYKGWYDADASLYPKQAGNRYYYDQKTGLMAKGWLNIDEQTTISMKSQDVEHHLVHLEAGEVPIERNYKMEKFVATPEEWFHAMGER